MPFADKFRATMAFPVVGDQIGGFRVEEVEVGHVGIGGGRYDYPVRIVVHGKGGKQGIKSAFKDLFSAINTTFSGYGNPYQCRIDKMEVEGLGENRYCIAAKGSGVRIYLEKELERFLRYLIENKAPAGLGEMAESDAVEKYMKLYQSEVEKLVRKNRYRQKKADNMSRS